VLAHNVEGGFTYTWFEPPPLVVQSAPDLAPVAAYYPAAAGAAALVLALVMPRWLRAIGFIALGATLPVLLVQRSGVLVASNGLFDAVTMWDWLILGGLALTFLATRTQALTRGYIPLALLCAIGGAAVLAWLAVPRDPSACDAWLGLASTQDWHGIPIARGFLRNQDFPEGTHWVWYVWWNVYLVFLVLFPLLSVRVLFRSSDMRSPTAEAAYGSLSVVLLALLMMPIVSAAFDVGGQVRHGEGEAAPAVQALVNAVNAARATIPPLLLPVLALTGLSDLLRYVFPDTWFPKAAK
jgi:hypothetical protein